MIKTQSNHFSMNPSSIMTLGVFLAIVAVVHLLYQGVIRPFAESAVAAYGSGATSNIWVIFKDFEQLNRIA